MNHHFETDSERWQAVRTKDRSADGAFVFAVRTTGVYCRPHCHSRLPLRTNVRFYAAPALAESDGFRACKRCSPALPLAPEPALEIARAACRQIETAEVPPSLGELAAAAGLSAYHFHRLFKKHVGVTPKQYATAQRIARFRAGLDAKRPVTDALYDAGFGSATRASESAGARLGMTASAYRAGGPGECISFATAASSLGLVGVAATQRGVCAIEFADDGAAFERALHLRFPRAAIQADEAGLRTTVDAVVRHIDAPGNALDLPLDVRGTAFQQRVWEALRRIPIGTTATYAEVAAAIGAPRAVRAVGNACGKNPVAVAIPCHRVVRNDGGEGGYRWGADRKQAILQSERARQGLAGSRR
jgi:AraC family transcriptional regulator of adaptative response/methylated-DNA-[protein]-cysteine methyltransferase